MELKFSTRMRPFVDALHWEVTIDDADTMAGEETVLTFSRVRP